VKEILVRARSLTMLAMAFAATAPLSAATVNLNSGANLQAALNAAQPGDTLILQAGGTFQGPITLPYKTGTGTDADWITIRTSTPDSSLPKGRRVTPADASKLAKIVSPGGGEPAIQTQPRAHHYRLIGLEAAPVNTAAFIYDLVILGTSGPDQDTLDEVPHHLAIERCYIHAFPTQGLKRGIQLNSASTDILDSYISDFKVVGQDSQAVLGWNGPGPFRIINNYLEGAGENVMFGGATATIPNLVPSDIEFRGNHLFKPRSWRVGDPSYAGTHWSVKNLFELKNARRVVVDGNVMENNWADAQVGVAVLFTPRSEDGAMPWAGVQDVQFTHNILRHTASAINVLGHDDGGPSLRTSRLTIRDNVFEDISGETWCGPGCTSKFLLITDSADVTLDHNTIFQDGSVIVGYGTPSAGFSFTNNIAPHNSYGVFGDGVGSGNIALSTYFPGAIFRRNVIPGASPSSYPADNFYPASLDDVGFVNRAAGNYRLASSSAYKGQGTDGKDPGADIDAVAAATAGAVSGTGTPAATQAPYGGSAAAVPGMIEAENFDTGGEGVATHDSDAGNNGGEYRSTDVDVRSKSTASNGYVVFNASAGEWLEYTIQVTAAGNYDIGATSASRLAGGTYHIEIDGVNVTGPLTAPTTGSWFDFQYAGKAGVPLTAGIHVLRLSLDTNGAETVVADFDTVVVAASTSGQTSFLGAPAAVPGTILAANFDNGGEGVAYHDETPGNSSSSTYRTSDVDLYGDSVVALDAGEWLEYTVDVAATASTYAFVFQTGTEGTGGELRAEVDGVDVTGPLSLPGGEVAFDWRSAVKTGISLTAGRHVIRVAVTGSFAGWRSLRIVNTATAQTPFGGTARTLPGTLKVVDFDEGGEGVAYHDDTIGCEGSCEYRTADVDRWGEWVNRTAAGEWMEYTVDVTTAGTYAFRVRVASDEDGGTFHIESNGVDVTGSLAIPNTGSWLTFQTVVRTGVSLTAGRKVLRLVVDSPTGLVWSAGTFDTIAVGP